MSHLEFGKKCTKCGCCVVLVFYINCRDQKALNGDHPQISSAVAINIVSRERYENQQWKEMFDRNCTFDGIKEQTISDIVFSTKVSHRI